MRVTRRQFTAAAVSLVAMAPLGCSTVPGKSEKPSRSLLDRVPWASKEQTDKPEPYPNPVKIAATWTPDTLVQTGRTPTRGFGGRVFFYDEKSRPVPVEGTLVIHGFDDSADASNQTKRFEFTPEQFTRHFSQGDLGASYSIWVPWDAVGGPQKRISLVTSFKTTEGKLVQGTPATLLLPGKSLETPEQEAVARYSPQYMKYRQAAESGSARSSGLTTTTIRRRTGTATESNLPGITIPSNGDRATKIAAGGGTPSVDLQMTRKPKRSSIMPASAQMPIKR